MIAIAGYDRAFYVGAVRRFSDPGIFLSPFRSGPHLSCWLLHIQEGSRVNEVNADIARAKADSEREAASEDQKIMGELSKLDPSAEVTTQNCSSCAVSYPLQCVVRDVSGTSHLGAVQDGSGMCFLMFLLRANFCDCYGPRSGESGIADMCFGHVSQCARTVLELLWVSLGTCLRSVFRFSRVFVWCFGRFWRVLDVCPGVLERFHGFLEIVYVFFCGAVAGRSKRKTLW